MTHLLEVHRIIHHKIILFQAFLGRHLKRLPLKKYQINYMAINKPQVAAKPVGEWRITSIGG